MSKNTDEKKNKGAKTNGAIGTSSTCSFEGKFISMAGSRLEVASERDRKSSYALASDALLTCDGKVCKGDSLKAGNRVRVTTQKGNANMVTGIEWLNKNKRFPALKTPAAK